MLFEFLLHPFLSPLKHLYIKNQAGKFEIFLIETHISKSPSGLVNASCRALPVAALYAGNICQLLAYLVPALRNAGEKKPAEAGLWHGAKT
jgi:hypothetical protein